ncbi:pinensin family lanthipeptide [Fulvivirga ulvae]|uniref:pinensin family lanthipeptide n=1 Tax=Fulvivirga ulvae TaxID=2904245 RepID=UPI001F21BA65|nr:pinensin family lanthipeptide [Fulvivirga ulvae]UII31097.1 pinensin family lanthipeptide [Fulvivirga ulvae]
MKKTKLTLTNLKVKSFVTEIPANQKTIQGGAPIDSFQSCEMTWCATCKNGLKSCDDDCISAGTGHCCNYSDQNTCNGGPC